MNGIWQDGRFVLASTLEARAELEPSRKDAERYRKLRGALFLRVFRTDRDGYPGDVLMGDDLDSALDAAQI